MGNTRTVGGEEVRVDYVTPSQTFWRVLASHRKMQEEALIQHFAGQTIVSLDPGETTGVAVWEGSLERIELFQLETKDIGQSYEMLEEILLHFKPDHLRVEEYRIYNWMADSHSWSVLHTPQLIGAIKVLAHKHQVPLTLKLAQHAKARWNDNVLKTCCLYSAGLHHARDASRHLFYYMSDPTSTD